ncbi:anhydro-N-acetylmuramic acid kinase [Comamonas odontotermitis]|uniref:anhydro-N-acetylmuramic acid kinase n=1 Tax=Comamonas odontotermitis TaxID=379895 RepID=UPI001CC3E933|nr:anhydro-N-acetylmuramic acid kinase [Comamonas odontotermitis]UBB16710.1 anhydro-N-acetylmuramic acid kinase [Comamonas odontotermitis]
MTERFIGLMSGTSLDGADGVLAQFEQGQLQVLQFATAPFSVALRAELLALNSACDNELHRAALAANALARGYAGVVHALLQGSGLQASDITAIGAHGQTVRHQPGLWDGTGYTLQINSPALLAELTGIPVVADFRSRDVAAGGQGAPLVPAFHQGVFGAPGALRWVLNVGGISNVSRLDLRTQSDVRGWDCGPGNALMDHWSQQHTGKPYDDGGRWAASGQVIPALLTALLAEPFLAQQPPKSTGRDLFNPAWLAPLLATHAAGTAPANVQATLAEFTAQAIAQDMQRHGAAPGQQLAVCGGGALNQHLMQRLAALLPGIQVGSTATHGLPPLQVEAAAFAWLAHQCWHGLPGNLPAVTGARGPRVLGAIYPA